MQNIIEYFKSRIITAGFATWIAVTYLYWTKSSYLPDMNFLQWLAFTGSVLGISILSSIVKKKNP